MPVASVFDGKPMRSAYAIEQGERFSSEMKRAEGGLWALIQHGIFLSLLNFTFARIVAHVLVETSIVFFFWV